MIVRRDRPPDRIGAGGPAWSGVQSFCGGESFRRAGPRRSGKPRAIQALGLLAFDEAGDLNSTTFSGRKPGGSTAAARVLRGRGASPFE